MKQPPISNFHAHFSQAQAGGNVGSVFFHDTFY